MVIGACTAMGWNAAHRLKEHERLWKAWEALLDRLAVELRYTMRPVQEVLSGFDRNEFVPLSWLAEYANAQESFHLPLGLCMEEAAFAREFFSFLGTSDLEGQLAHIARFRQQASQTACSAQERCAKLSGVYIAMGVCGGLCIGLLML